MKGKELISKFKVFGFWIFILAILYFLVDGLLLFWNYLEPEGISGLFYFTSYLKTLLLFIVSAIFLIVLFVFTFPRELTFKAFGRFFLAVIIVGIINPYVHYYLTGLAFENAIYGSIQKKYRLLNETENLVNDGKYVEANVNAIEVLNKAQEKRKKSSFFLLTNIYLHSESYQIQQLLNEYSAKLNLGYSFLELDKYDSALYYLNNVLTISKSHFSSFEEIDKIPKSLLAELYVRRGNIDSAFVILQDLKPNLEFDEKFDLKRYLINASIKKQYFNLIGNEKEADSITFRIRRAYENKYEKAGAVTYFEILTSNLELEIKFKNWDGARLTYEKLDDIVSNKHRNSANYYRYLIAKIEFWQLSKSFEASFEDKCISYKRSAINKINGLTTEGYLNKEIKESLQEAERICRKKYGENSKEWFHVMEYKINMLIQYKEFTQAKKELSKIDSQFKSTSNNLIRVKINQLNFILGFYLRQDTLVYKSFRKIDTFYTEYLVKSINKLTNDEKVVLVTLNDNWQKISEYILSQINTKESIQLLANSVLLNKGLSLRASLSDKNVVINSDWKEVQNALKADQVALQILRIVDPILKQVNPYYEALVYTKSDKQPELVKLGDESALKSLMSAKVTSSNFYHIYSNELRQCLTPLNPYILGKYKRVYLNTSGIYNAISFAALNPTVNVKFIEVLDFNNIKVQDRLTFKNPRILAYGGLKYVNTPKDISILQDRNSSPYLKYTLNEVRNIKKNFRDKDSVKVLTDGKGTEKSFRKEIVNNYGIVHLATHGYYDDFNHEYSYREQMHNCGVLFAPGRINVPENDGNLTAYDISTMNLSQTKLVVLSACNTGLGNENTYEGVFGFQRAFKIAGVSYVISSLWSIPDKGTAKFMEYFYKHLGEKKEVLDAFYLSQQEMKKDYSPYEWGGFVISK